MKQVRIGVIGTGKIGCEHIARIAKKIKNADVVACADTNHEFVASVAERFGIRCFETEEALIRSPEVDAILVAASDVLHEQNALAAIEEKKYILVEKPLAPDSAGCRRIVDAEMAGRKRLVNVAYMRRYDPYYRDLKRTLERENLGEPLMLHCVHRNYDAIRTHSTIENSLVHEVDICRWLLGENFRSVR